MLNTMHPTPGPDRPGHPGRRHRPDREAGNVALTALVLMVLSLLTVSMFIGARRSLTRADFDTDAGRAEATAELAVNEAFARIDGGETARFVDSGTVGETAYAYVAEPSGRSAWTVTAEATADGTSRALVATIGREPLYPHTVFVVDEFVSNRNTGTVAGRVGTNGSMTVTGPSPGDVQELYRPDGACRRCTDPLVLDGPRRLDPVPTPSGTIAPCPIDGRFAETVDAGGGLPFVCDDPSVPVVFDGEVIIDNPPLVVHVGSEVALTLDGATVNRGGPAADVRLFVEGAPSDGVNSVSATGAAVSGLLYGPGRSLTSDETVWVGAMTLARVEIERAGRFTVSEDTTIAPLGDDEWRIVDLRSVGSSR